MGAWQPIETAPKDGTNVILWGMPTHLGEGVSFSKPTRLTGYFDPIDDAWCVTTADWTGPFVTATMWQPLPEPPDAR